MAQTVTANKLTISHKGTTGFAMCSAPDVCKTPAAPSPIPIPYMIISKTSSLTGGTTTVKADGGNMIAIMGSKHASCLGDQPGSVGGVVSGVFGQASDYITFSPNVTADGKAVCRLTDKLLMNNKNTVCGPGGEFEIPVVGNDATETELCQQFCKAWETRKKCLKSGAAKCDKPSLIAEKNLKKALGDKNSPISKALAQTDPGCTAAPERLSYVKGNANYKGARSVMGKPAARRSIRRQVDKAISRGTIDPKKATAAQWRKAVPGMTQVLAGKTGKVDAKSARDAVAKAGDALPPQMIKVKPDFTVMNPDGSPKKIYDFKFPGDDWQKNKKQKQAYKAALGGKDPEVIDMQRCGGCKKKAKKKKAAKKK